MFKPMLRNQRGSAAWYIVLSAALTGILIFALSSSILSMATGGNMSIAEMVASLTGNGYLVAAPGDDFETANIKPDVNGTRDIGTTLLRYDDAWINDPYLDGYELDLATPEQGDVIYFNGSKWVKLVHGVAGQVLETGGDGANPAWGTDGGDTFPAGTQGNILYYNGAAWVVLAPGNLNDYLKSGGAGANVSWAALPTELPAGIQGNILYYNGSAWVALATGDAGQVLESGGAGANPAWGADDSDSTFVVVSAGDQDEIIAALADGVYVLLGADFTITAPITKAINNAYLDLNGFTITLANGSNCNMVNIGGDGWKIKNGAFVGNSANNTGTCRGISATADDSCILDDLEMSDFEDDIIMLYDDCHGWQFNRCNLHDSGGCVYTYDPEGVAEAYNLKFTACRFADCDTNSLTGNFASCTTNAYDWTFIGCTFEGTTGYMGAKVYGDYARMSFIGCIFDIGEATGGASPACIRFGYGGGGVVTGCTFKGAGNPATETYTSLSIQGGWNVVVSGNYFYKKVGHEGSHIALEAADGDYDVHDVAISGNVFGNVDATSNYHGIQLYCAATYALYNVSITGNTFGDDRGAGSEYYVGVAFVSDGLIHTIVISANTFYDMLTAGIWFYNTGAGSGNVTITNNHFYSIPTGIILDDGDDIKIDGNSFRSCTTPIDVNDSDVTRPMILNNDWYGCTNDANTTDATGELVANNIDKAGAWAWGDNVQ